jgi:hypothetical protein
MSSLPTSAFDLPDRLVAKRRREGLVRDGTQVLSPQNLHLVTDYRVGSSSRRCESDTFRNRSRPWTATRRCTG